MAVASSLIQRPATTGNDRHRRAAQLREDAGAVDGALDVAHANTGGNLDDKVGVGPADRTRIDAGHRPLGRTGPTPG